MFYLKTSLKYCKYVNKKYGLNLPPFLPIWLKGNFRTVLGVQWLPDHFWKWIEILKFLYLQNEQIMLAPLLLLLGFKGTVSRDFWPFFLLKDSTWAPYEQAKIVSWTFSFLRRYSRKICVRLVNDYAETGVSVVNNYADTRFSNFAIEYLRENEKFCETFLSIHSFF